MKTLILLSLLGLTRWGILTRYHATYEGHWTQAKHFELKENGHTLRLFFGDSLGENRVVRIDTIRGKK